MRFLNAIFRGLKLLYYFIRCSLKSLSNTLRELFGKFEALSNRVKIEVFKIFRLPPRFPKRVSLKLGVAILVAVIALSALVLGMEKFGIMRVFRSSGKVITKGVGVYEDSACSVPVSELSWGMVEPGSTDYIMAYLTNEGNVPVELSLYAVNWSPPNASSYIEFGWDYDNSTLNPDDIFKVTFHLCLSGDVQGIVDFMFDVIIDAIKA